MSKRLFIAIEPSDECRQVAASERARLEQRLEHPPIRWQPLENLHLTLGFLGDVADDAVEDCIHLLDRCTANARRFELATTNLGAFPSASRPSVVWLGVEATPARALRDLQATIAGAFRRVRADPKPFRPHITLGRVKGRGPRNRGAFVDALSASPAARAAWHPATVVLFQSELSPGGAAHRPVHVARLGGAD